MKYVAIHPVWCQTSADYQSERGIRTLSLLPTTTVAEIMEWANAWKGLGSGDVTISQCEELPAIEAAISKEKKL